LKDFFRSNHINKYIDNKDKGKNQYRYLSVIWNSQ